ncbi:MAG: SMP-30/gluconolactonase/LRE family protein [Oceanicaulis sp.]
MITLLLSAALSAAQPAEPRSVLDLSQDLRGAAREAAMVEDWEAARRHTLAARALQPGHPGLINNTLIIARFAGDLEAGFKALEDAAAHGLAWDLASVGQLDALRAADPERLARIEAALAANAAPAGAARLVAQPPLADALIEALVVDTETERLYLGSVADRRIYRVEPFAPETAEVFAGEAEPLGSIFGLAIDRRHGLLYAAEGRVPQTPMAEGETIETALLALDLDSGRIVARHTLEGAGRIGDVVVRDGVVYASDAEAGRIYRLNGPRAELELFAEDARFSSLQGLAPTRGAVYIADYAVGVWRIDAASRQARLLVPPPGGSLIGLDGLATDRMGRIFLIRNGVHPAGLFELELDMDGAPTALTPVLTGDARLVEPVTVRIADGRAFILADAQWRFFPEDGGAPDPARSDPPILSLPLP